jgi:4-amino-4-deoxy-L-arabinose transferase
MDTARGALVRSETRRAAIALAALFALLYLAPLGLRPLTSPDEVRYGEVAREMLVSGDWVSPHFNGVRYFEKPVLGHWLNAISLAALGESAYAVRLPVALATGLAALIVFLLARRFAGSFSAALAAGIYLTTLLVAGCGTTAVLDAFLALFVTAALAAYYVGIDEADGARRFAYLALCGAACGAALLVKGFVAWAIPVVVVAPYLAARREWRTFLTSPWLVIAVSVAVALPWAVSVHLREPDFWHYFFWVQHVQRFAGEGAQHARPPWFYVAYLPLIGWPWLLFVPAAVIGLRTGSRAAFRGSATAAAEARPDRRDRAFSWYLTAWAVMPAILFSLAKGKMVTYLLPCFAPLSILLAIGLEQYLAAGHRRAFRVAVALVGVMVATVLALLAASQDGIFGSALYTPAEWLKAGLLATFLIVALCCAAAAYVSSRPVLRLAAMGGLAVAVLLPLQLALPERVMNAVAPIGAVELVAAVSADTIVVADDSLFGTAAWVLDRDDIYVVSPGEIEYGLGYPESRHRWLKGSMLADLVAASRGRNDVLVLCLHKDEQRVAAQLPPTARRTEHGKVVMLRVPR